MNRARDILKLLDDALDFDAQNGTDREWSELLTQAMNARAVIIELLDERTAAIAATREECAKVADNACQAHKFYRADEIHTVIAAAIRAGGDD